MCQNERSKAPCRLVEEGPISTAWQAGWQASSHGGSAWSSEGRSHVNAMCAAQALSVNMYTTAKVGTIAKAKAKHGICTAGTLL